MNPESPAAAVVDKATRRPLIATTYEGRDPDYLARVLPLVDAIEVAPESVGESLERGFKLHEPTIAEIQRAAESVEILVHGVGLSLGSHDGWHKPYLKLLGGLLDRVDARWHSEHLGYTRVDGEDMAVMLAMPLTREAMDLVCDRIDYLHDHFKKPFLLENVARLFPDYIEGDFTPASFLNEVARRTGCGLLLDVYNLQCDAINFGLDLDAFLDELDLARVRELHLACGVKHREFQMDVHSRRLWPDTIALAKQVIARAGTVEAVTYELLRQAIPALGHDAIAEELVNLRAALATD